MYHVAQQFAKFIKMGIIIILNWLTQKILWKLTDERKEKRSWTQEKIVVNWQNLWHNKEISYCFITTNECFICLCLCACISTFFYFLW